MRTSRPRITEPRVTVRRPRRRRLPLARPLAPAAAPMAGPGLGAGPPGLPMGGPPGMPSMRRGGVVKRSGPHRLHKGEQVIPAKQVKAPPPKKKR